MISGEVTIRKRDHAGDVVMTYTGRVQFADEDVIVVRCPWPSEERVNLGPFTIGPGDIFFEYYYRRRHFNIFAIYDPRGILKGWYCNITRWPDVTAREIQWHDLALDLLVMPGGEQLLLDQDEFEALDLAPSLCRQARMALRTLQEWVSRARYPFLVASPNAVPARENSKADMEETLNRERYVFVVRLPRKIEIQIEDTYLILASVTKPTMGYHVTVLGPLCLREGVGPEALSVVSEICQQQDPFSIRVVGLGAFEAEDDNAVYLGVHPSDELMALQGALSEAMAELVVYSSDRSREWNQGGFCPHVTLGLALLDQELADFMEAGRQRTFDEVFEVDRIWLAAQEPNRAWRFVGDCALGGDHALGEGDVRDDSEPYCRAPD